MKFQTLYLSDDLSKVSGLVIVIDVLRAFTTSCFVFANGAEMIYPIASLQDALELKKQNPDWLLIGERKGLQVAGSDFGNSPTELSTKNLSHKTVILTTSAGTQAVDKLVSAEKIITGAFVNATAIARYIRAHDYKNISFVCTDNRWHDNEDYMFTQYLTDLLLDKQPNFLEVRRHLDTHVCTDGFLRKPFTKTSQTDYELAMDLDRFDFVIEASIDPEATILVRV